jgi:probable F420-dependent oxidoreductase
MEGRPFRFAVQCHSAASRDEWIGYARRAESIGYDVFCIPDHAGTQLSPFAALTAVAGATERIGVGTFVLDNDFRHPLLTAHEAASVQLLSGGRVELGLGAGWLRRDYERLGIEFAPPRVRVERLEEAVEIVCRYFDGDVFSFAGRHYEVTEAEPLPLPPDLGRPRLLVGGGGRRVLRLAAARADTASVFLTARPEGSAFEPMSSAGHAAKIRHLREAAAGRDVEVNVLLQVFDVTNHRHEALERWARDFETTPEELLALPFALVGTVDQIVEDLLRHREAYGLSYVTARVDQLEEFAPVIERLAGR